MIDCGFALREAEKRLDRLSIQPADIAAIFVTHEHQDHIAGVFKLARRYDIPVWMTRGTHRVVAKYSNSVDIRFCRDGSPISVGTLSVLPYTVPHDAREPVQFTVSDGQMRLGILTDAGHLTSHLVQALNGCDALIIECNHETSLLAESTYPASLKRRIGGHYGHLSNEAAASILTAVDCGRLHTVIGAHLSRQNNTPDHAYNAIATAVDIEQTEIVIACQENGFEWIDLKARVPGRGI